MTCHYPTPPLQRRSMRGMHWASRLDRHTGKDFWRPRFIRITTFSFQRPIKAHIQVQRLPGPRPESRSARGQKSPAGGCPFHASALRDTNPVAGRGSGSSHIDPNMLCAPRSGSFLVGSPTKLAAGDALATFYTNHMLTQKCKQKR
jgi:hypothetical protein